MPVIPDLQEAEARRLQVLRWSGLLSSGPAGSSVGPCLKVVKAGDVARVLQSPVSQSPDWGKSPSTIYVLILSHFWEKRT